MIFQVGSMIVLQQHYIFVWIFMNVLLVVYTGSIEICHPCNYILIDSIQFQKERTAKTRSSAHAHPLETNTNDVPKNWIQFDSGVTMSFAHRHKFSIIILTCFC